jgi:hypothetical protein
MAESAPRRTAFYCVSSSVYFLGAVALINSLRLQGHEEPIFVLDFGLEPEQRGLLRSEATLVEAPDDVTPFLLKTVAPRRHPADVMVLIDADIIVTRPLEELIDQAASGRVLAIEHGQDRFFAEWGSLLGLGPATHRRYVSSSLIVAGGEIGSRVIRLMDEARLKVPIERTPYAVPEPDLLSLGASLQERMDADPFFYADQDVLNAVLACEEDQSAIEVLDRSLEAIIPFTGLEVTDLSALRCRFADGLEPYAVHHYLPAKPWLKPTIPGVYTELLLRLLHGADAAIHVPPEQLPPHLRPGVAGAARRWYGGVAKERLRAARGRLSRRGQKASHSG